MMPIGDLDVIDLGELIATIIQALEKLGFEVTFKSINEESGELDAS